MRRPFASNCVGDYFMLPDGRRIAVLFSLNVSNSFKKRMQFLAEKLVVKLKTEGTYDYIYNRCNLPLRSISHEGRHGVILPTFPKEFYFTSGNFNGKAREVIWFCSERMRKKFLDISDRGNWYYFVIAIKQIAAVLSLLENKGYVLYDLSYKTILFNPNNGHIYMILWDSIGRAGIDQLNILPTPDFASPESIIYRRRSSNEPTIYSNRHSLAVLNYMLLFHRHPLRGKQINDMDPSLDEELSMGVKALFVENPVDKSNSVDISNLEDCEKLYGNPELRPYSLSGKFLKELFDRSFIDGLHNPANRPTSFEWFMAAEKTIGLLIPCSNPECEEKWFVYNNESNPVCPFCGTKVRESYPVLNFYTRRNAGSFISDNLRMVVSKEKQLNFRHICNHSSDSIIKHDLDEKPYCVFSNENGKWFLVNKRLNNLLIIDGSEKDKILLEDKVELKNGLKLVLDCVSRDRMIVVQMLKT